MPQEHGPATPLWQHRLLAAGDVKGSTETGFSRFGATTFTLPQEVCSREPKQLGVMATVPLVVCSRMFPNTPGNLSTIPTLIVIRHSRRRRLSQPAVGGYGHARRALMATVGVCYRGMGKRRRLREVWYAT